MKKTFVECAREKMRGVVQIHVEGQREDDPEAILSPDFMTLATWSGSGFFVKVDKEEGLVLTNAHVVRNAGTIQIMSMLTSGEKFQVEVVGIVKNLEPDVALLRLSKKELKRFMKFSCEEITYLELAKDALVVRGTNIKAIGYPLEMIEPNITTGEVTNFIASTRDTVEQYVTDAAINLGNSGGPAIIETGEVIGLNTAILSGAENVGFVTPVAFTHIILKNLLKKGEPCFSDLGGGLQKNSSPMAKYLKQKGEVSGLIVNKVEKDAFLDLLDIKEKDIILSINGCRFDRHGQVFDKPKTHHKNIFDVVKLVPIGEIIEIEILREGQSFILSAPALPRTNTGTRSVPLFKEREFYNVFGFTVQELDYEIINAFHAIDLGVHYNLVRHINEKEQSLVVTHVNLTEQADEQDWKTGEVIESVNGKMVRTLNDFKKQVRNIKRASRAKKFFIKCKSGTLGVFHHNK